MNMIKLQDYIMKDGYQERIKLDVCTYELYGVTSQGLIFNRISNDEVLYHECNGVKIYEKTTVIVDGTWFVNSNSKFYRHYCNENDYNYYYKKLNFEDIERYVKQLIYLKLPNLYTATCLGYSSDNVLDNPNRCTATVVLNDCIMYDITKIKDTVKIFRDSEEIIKFKLDKNDYEKTLELNKLKRIIASKLYGKLNDETVKKYIKFKSDLEEKYLCE